MQGKHTNDLATIWGGSHEMPLRVSELSKHVRNAVMGTFLASYACESPFLHTGMLLHACMSAHTHAVFL